MKELTYIVKDIKDKDDLFWFKYLEETNRNKFVVEETLNNIFKHFKFECDVCVIESTSQYKDFKCIYKTNTNIDDKMWVLVKRNLLVEVAKKNQLQNVEVKKKGKEDGEVLKQSYFIHPIPVKEKVYYIIFNEFDIKFKPRYAIAFEVLYNLFRTCETNELLSKYAMIDTVTGCYNFNQFQKSLGVEISKTDRIVDKDIVFSVIVMDIEGLDRINDSYGYTCGDAVLKFVATAIKDKIRTADDVYRIGDDEFCVIATYAQKTTCADFILPRITQEVSKKLHIGKEYYEPKLNIAIVEYKKGMTRTEFVKIMEDSLKKSKETGEIVIV